MFVPSQVVENINLWILRMQDSTVGGMVEVPCHNALVLDPTTVCSQPL